jgi:HEAT repeat protein
VRRFKGAIILISCFAVLVSLCWWWFPRGRSEGPLCKGHRLSYWVEVFGQFELRQLKTGPQFPEGYQLLSEAKQAVAEAGTNAFPYLLKWLHYEGPPLRSRFPDRMRRFIRDRKKLELKLTSHGELRDEGVTIAFRILRTNATPATIQELARLVDTTSSPLTARQATLILIDLAPAGLLPIAKVLQNPRHPMREIAVHIISVAAPSFDSSGEQLLPGLIRCLRDAPPPTAALAAAALGRLKPSASMAVPVLAVPALAASLQSNNAQLRAAAAESLAALEVHALLTLPALTNLLADTDANVRLAATNAVRVLNAVAVTNASPR